jgi:hypothetical protein
MRGGTCKRAFFWLKDPPEATPMPGAARGAPCLTSCVLPDSLLNDSFGEDGTYRYRVDQRHSNSVVRERLTCANFRHPQMPTANPFLFI